MTLVSQLTTPFCQLRRYKLKLVGTTSGCGVKQIERDPNTRTARTDPWSNLLCARSLEKAGWTWDQRAEEDSGRRPHTTLGP